MELWLLYTFIAMLFAGLHSFAIKIAAQHNHNADANTAYSAMVATVVATAFFLFQHEPIQALPILFFVFAIGNGVAYSIGSNARIESLQRIDATLFFPLYKTIGPVIAVIAGIFLFNEHITKTEYIGIALSILVPLLLLSRSEKFRQKELFAGLLFMLVSVLFVMSSQIMNKYATNLSDNILLYVAISFATTSITSTILLFRHAHSKNVSVSTVTTSSVLFLSLFAGIFQAIGFYALVEAFRLGDLSIVFTAHSLYIVIPILLSLWWFNEHINARKAAAVAVSLIAIMFLA